MVTAERVGELVAAVASESAPVVETERYGHNGWAVGKHTFAWLRPFSKADVKRFGDDRIPADPILAVLTDGLAEKEAILAEDRPGVFTIEHLNGYPAVLVELSRVRLRDVRELVQDAYRAAAAR